MELLPDVSGGLFAGLSFKIHEGVLYRFSKSSARVYVPSNIVRVLRKRGVIITRKFQSLPNYPLEHISFTALVRSGSAEEIVELIHNGYIECRKKNLPMIRRIIKRLHRTHILRTPGTERSTEVSYKGFRVIVIHAPSDMDDDVLSIIPLSPYPLDSILNILGMSTYYFGTMFQKNLGRRVSESGQIYYHFPIYNIDNDLLGLSMILNPTSPGDRLLLSTLSFRSYVDTLKRFRRKDRFRLTPELESIGPSVRTLAARNYLRTKDIMLGIIQRITKDIKVIYVVMRQSSQAKYDKFVEEISRGKKRK